MWKLKGYRVRITDLGYEPLCIKLRPIFMMIKGLTLHAISSYGSDSWISSRRLD